MKARDAAPWLSQENLLRFVVACAVLGITGAAGEGAASKATTEGFALVDTDKSGSITPGEWDSAASSGVLATVAAKIAASAAASVSSVSQFPVALLNSITMTIATELGDKTFCIAAVMAMRYPRSAVFAGAILVSRCCTAEKAVRTLGLLFLLLSPFPLLAVVLLSLCRPCSP